MSAPVVRRATAGDAEATAPLVHASGPELLDFLFGTAGDETVRRIAGCSLSARGSFGWEYRHVLEVDGVVVATASAYTGAALLTDSWGSISGLARSSGWTRLPGLVIRGLRLGRLVREPGARTLLISQVGVAPSHRRRGHGARLVTTILAAHPGLRAVELDVAESNHAARSLYAGLGFEVVTRRELPGLPAQLRMRRDPERPELAPDRASK